MSLPFSFVQMAGRLRRGALLMTASVSRLQTSVIDMHPDLVIWLIQPLAD
ncbi:hypothetical protein IVA95_29875 [Bradyrhizobium sp. 157]|nr:hypothetical protein [Bradyrhizobium sp. 157]MCK1641638.1 hypothetical protein [Bradyrhizobium sp. 157]